MSGYERLLSEHRWTTVARRTGRGYDFSPVCMCGEATRTEVAHERHLASVLADAGDARAEAWDEGRAAERRDWEFLWDLSTPDEDRQPLSNPYR